MLAVICMYMGMHALWFDCCMDDLYGWSVWMIWMIWMIWMKGMCMVLNPGFDVVCVKVMCMVLDTKYKVPQPHSSILLHAIFITAPLDQSVLRRFGQYGSHVSSFARANLIGTKEQSESPEEPAMQGQIDHVNSVGIRGLFCKGQSIGHQAAVRISRGACHAGLNRSCTSSGDSRAPSQGPIK